MLLCDVMMEGRFRAAIRFRPETARGEEGGGAGSSRRLRGAEWSRGRGPVISARNNVRFAGRPPHAASSLTTVVSLRGLNKRQDRMTVLIAGIRLLHEDRAGDGEPKQRQQADLDQNANDQIPAEPAFVLIYSLVFPAVMRRSG